MHLALLCWNEIVFRVSAMEVISTTSACSPSSKSSNSCVAKSKVRKKTHQCRTPYEQTPSSPNCAKPKLKVATSPGASKVILNKYSLLDRLLDLFLETWPSVRGLLNGNWSFLEVWFLWVLYASLTLSVFGLRLRYWNARRAIEGFMACMRWACQFAGSQMASRRQFCTVLPALDAWWDEWLYCSDTSISYLSSIIFLLKIIDIFPNCSIS